MYNRHQNYIVWSEWTSLCPGKIVMYNLYVIFLSLYVFLRRALNPQLCEIKVCYLTYIEIF
jgi:hypothetical protein